jgi:cobalt-zinc-cadmium efflux system membrane fusion protein
MKMKIFKIASYLLLFQLIFVYSCKKDESSESKNEPIQKTEDATIHLSEDQIIYSGIETGVIETRNISSFVECIGKIKIPPKSKYAVYSTVKGKVGRINLVEGQYIKRGTALTRITHQDIIHLQQEYLESKSRIDFLEKEVERQNSLITNNATSQRELESIQSTYAIAQSKLSGISAELDLIGISIDQLNTNKIQESVGIYAPISGYLTAIHVNPGQFILDESQLFEIIDINNRHADLNVYPKDIGKIKAGQKVEIFLAGDDHTYGGKLEFVSKSLDLDNNTISAHASLDDKNLKLAVGMMIQARIFTSSNMVKCLPKEAVIKKEEGSFIFVKKADGFERLAVETGIEDENFIELIDSPLGNEDLVAIKGAYYILGTEVMEE